MLTHLNILNATLDGVLLIQQDGRINFSNHAASAMLGYSHDELKALTIEELLPEAFRCPHMRQRSDYMKSPQTRQMHQDKHFTAMRKDGSTFPVSISLNPTTIDGELYICSAIQDLTSLEEAAFKLEQSQKLEALGEMVSGIAHNFNNTIAGIAGQAYLLERKELLSEQAQQRVASISTMCGQAADIIKQLLLYARPQSADRLDFELNATTDEVINMAQVTTPKHITLSTHLSDQPLHIHGMPSQIQQTLLNFINNSIHAIDDRQGAITISTMICEGHLCPLKQCQLNRDHASSFVCTQVHDTGKGIAPKHLHRIFDPFFSTKAPSKGTGLGLSTSYGIIKKHGGKISVHSTLGKGTTMQFFLPVARPALQQAPIIPALPATVSQQGSLILIIDDEASIRDMLSEVFKELGYSTIEADNGQDGLALFTQHQEEIQLVISDLAMPKLNGKEVLTAIRNMNSATPFLFITGYQDHSLDETILCSNTKLMLKPFDVTELSHQVKALISA